MNPKIIVSDFDGVMTDNQVWINEKGEETVMVSRADGMGIEMLRKCGVEVIIMSTETNAVVSARAKKLKIPVLQAVKDKEITLKKYCDDRNISLSDVMYVGNDINDLPALKIAGYKVVPNDAYKQVKDIADVVLRTNGGQGVLREIAEMIGER